MDDIKMRDVPGEGQLNKDEMAIRRVGSALHKLNNAIIEAVQSGITIELVRTSRYHDEAGSWGDLLVPVIRTDSKDS